MAKKIALSPFLEEALLRQAGVSYPFNPHAKEIKKIAANVKKISDEYISADKDLQQLFNQEDLLRAYLVYFLPVNLVKIYPILDELFAHPGIKIFQGTSFSILDLGCGPGTFLLGVLEYLASHKRVLSANLQQIELWGIDQVQENLSLAKKLIAEYIKTSSNFKTIKWDAHFKSDSITSPKFPSSLLLEHTQFDLLIAGNILTELPVESFSAIAHACDKLLAKDGTLLLIDPGTRASSRRLIYLRNRILVKTSLTLYAPCLAVAHCPMLDNPKDWCHQKLVWQPPAIVAAIDSCLGFTKEKGIQYSYFTFRKDGKTVADIFRNVPQQHAWRVVSYVMRHKGEERLFVCNGKERVMLRRMTRNASEENEDFSLAVRGNCIVFAGCEKRETFYEITRSSTFRIMRSQ